MIVKAAQQPPAQGEQAEDLDAAGAPLVLFTPAGLP